MYCCGGRTATHRRRGPVVGRFGRRRHGRRTWRRGRRGGEQVELRRVGGFAAGHGLLRVRFEEDVIGDEDTDGRAGGNPKGRPEVQFTVDDPASRSRRFLRRRVAEASREPLIVLVLRFIGQDAEDR